MENQSKDNERNDTFNSPEFIQFTADLIRTLYIFHILLSNILWNFGKTKFRQILENWFEPVIA